MICAGCAAAADDPQTNLLADEYVHADVREYDHRKNCTGCDCQHRVRAAQGLLPVPEDEQAGGDRG